MWPETPSPVGYVVKRYPRFSETFIVNEMLAHEAAGQPLEIFSLYPPNDSHFQDTLAQVRAPVTYLPRHGVKIEEFWEALEQAAAHAPLLWSRLPELCGENARDVYQGVTLAALAHERGIRHLHAHFATAAASVARIAAKLGGLRYSFTAHAKDIYHEDVDPADLRRKLRDASAVVTVSDFNLGWLHERYGPSATHMQRIYNGLDLARFPYESPVVRPPRIVAVGRFVEKKGIETLIDACALLAARDLTFRCELIGGGELESELRARVARHGLEWCVELSGPRPQAEVIARVRAAAALAAPCIEGADGNRDGLPTVLLEAMALGTPCVATNVTGIPELIHDDITGLLIAQRDPYALATALERLLHDAGLRTRLARQARALIEARFDIHRNAVALRDLFVSSAASQAMDSLAAQPIPELSVLTEREVLEVLEEELEMEGVAS